MNFSITKDTKVIISFLMSYFNQNRDYLSKLEVREWISDTIAGYQNSLVSYEARKYGLGLTYPIALVNYNTYPDGDKRRNLPLNLFATHILKGYLDEALGKRFNLIDDGRQLISYADEPHVVTSKIVLGFIATELLNLLEVSEVKPNGEVELKSRKPIFTRAYLPKSINIDLYVWDVFSYVLDNKEGTNREVLHYKIHITKSGRVSASFNPHPRTLTIDDPFETINRNHQRMECNLDEIEDR